tara:strand:- start:1010 stop:2125 length:1116 start_codon:yes stop_codon:yes gene_type:complete
MLSILHILNKYDLTQGGPPRAVNNIFSILKKKKIKTYLISTLNNNSHQTKNKYIGRNIIKRFSVPDLNFILHLRKKIKEYDIIHIHCMWNIITTLSFFLARFYKKKIIFSPHGTLERKNLTKNLLLKKLYYYLFEKRNIKNIDLIHFLSKEEKINSNYLNTKNYFISSNGLNFDEFIFKKKYKTNIFNKNKFNILNIGRFNKIKGLDLQLELIKKLNEKVDNYRLIFIGPNDDQKNLYKKKVKIMKISKYVKFLPPIFSNKRFKIMHDSNLVINTSYYECNSMTILEALTSGALVLAVDKANVNHQSKYNALIKTKRNLLDICNNVELLRNNKKLQKRIRNNGINYAKKYLDTNITIKNYLNQYIKVSKLK